MGQLVRSQRGEYVKHHGGPSYRLEACTVTQVTAKAIRVEKAGMDEWLPTGQVTSYTKKFLEGGARDQDEVVMTDWIARKKGFVS